MDRKGLPWSPEHMHMRCINVNGRTKSFDLAGILDFGNRANLCLWCWQPGGLRVAPAGRVASAVPAPESVVAVLRSSSPTGGRSGMVYPWWESNRRPFVVQWPGSTWGMGTASGCWAVGRTLSCVQGAGTPKAGTVRCRVPLSGKTTVRRGSRA